MTARELNAGDRSVVTTEHGAKDKLDYIDAVRAIAVLGVVSVHVAQKVEGLPSYLETAFLGGAYGVQLFFAASAFTLLLSWHKRPDGALPFYVRRLFRIVPLFWLATLGYSLISSAPIGQTIRTLFFAFNLTPSDIGSVVPGSWSIAVEVQFYLIFPLLAAYFIKSLWSAVAFLLSSLLLIYGIGFAFSMIFSTHPVKANWIWDYGHLWFPGALPAFAAGFVAFFLVRTISWPAKVWHLNAALLIGAVCAPAMLPLISKFLIPIVFIVLIYAMANGAGRWLHGHAIRHVGLISFGMYLWHFAILDLTTSLVPVASLPPVLGFGILFGLTLGITVIAATFTYNCVEQPAIAFGRSVSKMVRRSPQRA